MITTLRKAFYKHGYLIIIAAWLFTISFIVANYWYYNSSPTKVKSRLEHKIAASERTFNTIVKDTTLLSSLINDTLTKGKKQLTEENFGIFIYTVNDIGNPLLSYWNSNHFSVNPEDLRREDSNYFTGYQSGRFEFIKRTVPLAGKKVIAAAVIPVYWDYFIQNKYLPKDFDGFPGMEEQYEISEDSTGLPVLSTTGQTLFKIRQKQGHSYAGYDMITVLLRVVSMLLIVLFLNVVATDASKEEGFKKVFLLLCATVVLLRFFTYILPFPFDFSRLSLFDPSIYASNFLHPSLGHLLINSILAFWLISFYKINSFREPVSLPQSSRPWVKYTNLFVLVVVALLIAGIIRSLVQDSRISFDVTNFFSLINAYSVVSFIILCFLFLSFYYLSQVLLRPLIEARIDIAYQLLATAVSGLFILSFSIGRSSTNGNIVLIAWLLLYIWLMNKRRHDLYVSLLKSSFFIFWAMFFAMSVASLVMYQNKVVEIDIRKKKAEGLANQEDPSGENMLRMAVSTFNDNNFSAKSFYHLRYEYSNKAFKDSLLNANFSGYLNKYETRIYTFSHDHHPLFNDDSTDYLIIQNIISNPATQRVSTTDSLYTYKNVEGQMSYLYEKIIAQADSVLGYVYIISKPKRYNGEALSLELFNQVQDNDLQEYATAVYINGKLANKENDYGFPLRLNKQVLPAAFDYLQYDVDGYNELWYNDGNGRIVIVVKQNNLLLEAVTLFAYLFIIFLLVICLYDMGSYLLQTRFQVEEMKQLLRFNIRTQIHATIIFISVFSFLVIGIATISFFIIRFKKNTLERLSNNIEIIANEIEGKVKEVSSTDDAYTIDDVGFTTVNAKMIREIAGIHNVDANLYSPTGDQIASTEPYIYNKQLLSMKMDANAYNELHYKKSIRFVQSEQLANLQYLSIYVPVLDENGHTTAYLNIPYLNSQSELNQEISGFLATLINLNAFIFLLAGAIAFLLTNRIIASFSLIGDKMKEVGLGKVNEVIIWNRDDEIGALVNEYNKMVHKLEESAKALAQNEREGAWREMARQVAHEIKNPLTPMKLSIQYLQKSIDSGAPNTKELSQRVAVTLVEQIDQLSQIASDFSQFANISNVNPERFDINESIASVINLYKGNTDVEIEWKKHTSPARVIADKIQLNRLFTNLIKNAIEATEEGKRSHITIEQDIQYGNVRISITDNGSGIPAPMREKIFAPNFTTKTSGTGLGLAICKGIVEKANGTISFTTEEGVGTTFVIELPVNG